MQTLEIKIQKTYHGGLFDKPTRHDVFQKLKKEKLPKHQSFAQLLEELRR